jgi:hypothetical protein
MSMDGAVQIRDGKKIENSNTIYVGLLRIGPGSRQVGQGAVRMGQGVGMGLLFLQFHKKIKKSSTQWLRVSMIPFYSFIRFVPYSIRWIWIKKISVNLFDIGKGKKFISLSKWVRIWIKIIS